MASKSIQLVVTDLDRTLLREDKTLSAYTRETLDLLRARGVPFAVATARPIRAVRQLGLPQYDAAVFHNGAVVMAGDRVLEKVGLADPLGTVTALLRDRPESKISVESEDRMYSNLAAEELWPGVEYVKTADFREVRGMVADKILVEAHSTAELDALGPYAPEEAYWQLSENTVAMLMNRRATKVNGIRLLCGHFGIGLDQVAAFGDDYNDVEMLRACGVGVAVGNALPEVKAAADGVCPSNQEDGVARWLRENVLMESA